MRLHKSRFFASGWANYADAVPGTLRLTPPPDRIDAIRADYEAMQQMFIGQRMPFEDVLAMLKEAESVLNRS